MKWLLFLGVSLALALPLSAQDGAPIKIAQTVKKTKVKPKRIRVLFGTVPKGVGARVIHGRKQLGVTPFTHHFKYD